MFERGDGFGIIAAGQGRRCISKQAKPLRPLNGTALEFLAKLLLRQKEQVGDLVVDSNLARLKGRFLRREEGWVARRGVCSVYRTHLLTDVAAVDAVAGGGEGGTEFGGDLAF